jgi:hypothetical protein
MEKKLIAFDVDGTLSLSRSKIDSEIAELLKKLLSTKQVAIITGGAFADIEKQILSEIGLNNKLNKNLTLLPTNGGGLYIFNNKWEKISGYKLTIDEKEKIINAIKETEQQNPELCTDPNYGAKIQDRNSEITYSALGENAPVELKQIWDKDFSKRIKLQNVLKEKLPEFEVKIGGTTSIDITPKGMDKAYGINKLIEHFKLIREDILFVGDAVYENGNDYPVFQTGIETIKTSGPEETKEIIRKLI